MKKNILTFIIFSSVSIFAQAIDKHDITFSEHISPIDIDHILYPSEDFLTQEPEDYLDPPVPSGKSCFHIINAFKNKYPPFTEIGDPPIPELVEQKVSRASFLWKISAPHNHAFHNYTCINEVRNTCWEYCGTGIEQPGNIHLHCIIMACMNYTSDPIEEMSDNYSLLN